MIDWFAGDVRPVLREDFCRSLTAIDKGRHIPCFFISERWFVVGAALGHIVFYVACQAADTKQSRAGVEAVRAPERRIDIAGAIRVEGAATLFAVAAQAIRLVNRAAIIRVCGAGEEGEVPDAGGFWFYSLWNL